jgi:hypothetical protein
LIWEQLVVIGDKFVWAHFPKTAGDSTLALFGFFPELTRFADPVDSNAKHSRFEQRDDQLDGKVLAMNLRRLPAWELSYRMHRDRHFTEQDGGKLPLLADEMAASTSADGKLTRFLGHGRYRIDHWLRSEHLADDFLDFVSRFATVSRRQRWRVSRSKTLNRNHYEHDLRSWFSGDQLKELYANNPVWSEIERQTYGNLLIDT